MSEDIKKNSALLYSLSNTPQSARIAAIKGEINIFYYLLYVKIIIFFVSFLNSESNYSADL